MRPRALVPPGLFIAMALLLQTSTYRKVCAGADSENSSEQRPAKDHQCHAEVDAQACDIHECRDERRGARRRIKPYAAEDERKHAARKRAEEHHTDKAEADGEADQIRMP